MLGTMLFILASSCLSLCFLSTLASPPPSSYIVTDVFCNPKNTENCKKYTSPRLENLSSIEGTKFLDMATNAAINRALYALKHIKQHESTFQNVVEKLALSDCQEFYTSTIRQLNQTLNPRLKPTSFDIQTWLSAALTNLENCKTSMNELNVTNPFLVFISDNVSKLIKNSLAINGELMEEDMNYQTGFPSWLSDGNLRVLRVPKYRANYVVAQDGSGDFRSITTALHASNSQRKHNARIVIHIKQGTYREYLEISSEMKNIMLVGDGIGKTIITGSKSFAAGYTTFQSATVKVMGDGFIARGITFQNTAGPQGYQAVALYSSSDLSTFYRCSFEGYQDTLWADSHRQFYQKCHIYGTIDFIFGNAAVVFQNSFIYARRPIQGQSIVITAQGRAYPSQATGISIINCSVQAGPDLTPVIGQFKAYLGRPWSKFSRTVYLRSFLDGLISPTGWLEWSGENRKSTVYYGEYKNYGPGSSTSGRVKWPGYRTITNAAEAEKFCVGRFIDGWAWLPKTGVPFSSRLSA